MRMERALTVFGLLALSALDATASHTSFQSTCYPASDTTVNYPVLVWRRSDARAYAAVGAGEGYQWGGGCWNDNGVDDAPGDPPQNSGTRGEGGDCSGFTFKAWGMKTSGQGLKYWNRMTNVHGPYAAASYHAGSGPFELVPKSTASTKVMDAFASTSHIGMIYTEGTSNGLDTIVEAKCESCGTGIWTRSYRGSPAYRAVRRIGFTPESMPTPTVVGIAARAQGDGYWLAGSDGGVFSFGGAPFFGSLPGLGIVADDVVGIAARPQGDGYWLVAADGAVWALGAAGFFGSMEGEPLNAPIVGMAPHPSGQGYWLVGGDGGVFAFGAAGFHGSMGGMPLNAPIAGIAAHAGGQGYWLAGADGGVFAFGAAGFHGSMGGQPLNAPVVGIAPTPSGAGYRLAGGDGGVFCFGDATFHGSMAGKPLNRPVVGIAGYQPTGHGYWLGAGDGGVFAFGDAPFYGSGPSLRRDVPTRVEPETVRTAR